MAVSVVCLRQEDLRKRVDDCIAMSGGSLDGTEK